MSYLTLNKTMHHHALNNSNASGNPFYEIRHEMGKLLHGLWSSPGATKNLQEIDSQWIPACDVEEADNHYLISLEIAGVPKDHVRVEFHDNQIVISGERQSETNKKENGRWYSERQFGKFQRAFMLPSGIDPEQVEAKHQDGVLRIYVPKAESAKPRQIKITNGNGPSSFKKLIGQAPPNQAEGKGGTTFT